MPDTKSGEVTVTGLLAEIADEFCNEYCRYPDKYEDEEELITRHCDQCPLQKI